MAYSFEAERELLASILGRWLVGSSNILAAPIYTVPSRRIDRPSYTNATGRHISMPKAHFIRPNPAEHSRRTLLTPRLRH